MVLATHPCVLLAQQSPAPNDSAASWDNQLFVGTRAAYATGTWRLSGEFQARFKNNWRALDNWFVEGVATYNPVKNWEFASDFRVSVKATRIEYRPGLGVIFKALATKWQFVHQLKYQADIASTGQVGHGVRQVVFVNHIATPKLVPNVAAGWFYRWREGFSGVEFVRFGGGLTIIFDPVHTLTLQYFVGAFNRGNRWTWSGIPLLQLTINVRSDWKYVPAKLINF